MLFDLRGRGRRRTVQAVYLGLAVLIGGGLILFGVGTGTGGGGLLNGIGGNGSGNNQNQVVSQQERAALAAVKAQPNSAAAWAGLVQARWTVAGEGNNFNSSTGTFSATGRKEVLGATQAWQRYLQLAHGTDPNGIAILAARAYGSLGDYAGAATAWEVETASAPSEVKGYECLAASAYAAKQTRKGDLALAKALSLVPKTQRTILKSQISQAKTRPSIAQTC